MLLQKQYGWIGVKDVNGAKSIVMVNADSGAPVEVATVALNQITVYLKADCNFINRTDKGYFYYSLDGKTWTALGSALKMAYTIPHFMGYRFGLFNYATKTTGGFADFDYFHISQNIEPKSMAESK
jgi:beta-xylosidase